MKSYLVDVPVKINIWIRPECQKRQFEVIKKARPSIIFLQSDGGRNEEEWEKIYENRKLVDEGIDWDCKVYRLYEDHNNGLYKMGMKTRELIWSTVDRCVFLEDDQIPSVSYFRFCAELLEKYKDDERIECICGVNHLGISDAVQSDYFFSRQGSVWGTASWKRVCDSCNSFEYYNDSYVMKLLKQRTRNNHSIWRQLKAYATVGNYDGHVPANEFWNEFDMYAQNRLQIIPKVNMISNIGIGADSEHADELSQLPRGIRRVFNMKTYEVNFPIKHAKYVIPDVEYEKKRNRIMAYNKPVIASWRRIERAWIKLQNGDLKYIINKLKNKRMIEN